MEKQVDSYADLPYTVVLEPDGEGYRASVEELPGCHANVGASEGVDELWRRLKEAQRRRIEQLLEHGEAVPEPAGARVDPFWADHPEGLTEQEARTMLYRDGVSFFPFSVLVELWLQELQHAGVAEIGPSEVPLKGGTRHLDQTASAQEGDLRPVRLGKGRKVAWVRLDGPRTRHGHRAVELLDQPLRTEAAVVAALTILEASVVRDADFKGLCEALGKHVKAHPELREKNLEEVLAKLPRRWFSAQKDAIDEVMKELPTEERNKHTGHTWERRERDLRLWKRTLTFLAALLRQHQPDFDARPLKEQLELLDRQRKRVNMFLEQQRKLAAFLEYGTRTGLPKAVQNARDQVEAAVLADVEKRRQRDIAVELGLDVPEDRYEVDMKIPQVADLVRDGRALLDKVMGEGGWRWKAEEMRGEAARYRSLSEEERKVEALAENTGWSVEDARSLYRTNPEVARFLATPLYP